MHRHAGQPAVAYNGIIVCPTCDVGPCNEVFLAANVRKWEGMTKDDENELEKLKKEEQKMMKVRLQFDSIYFALNSK